MESVIESTSYFKGNLKMLSFIVRELTGREYQINDFSYRSTVFMLKSVLARMSTSNYLEESIRLIFGRRVFEDNEQIISSSTTNGSVVHFIRRNRGGTRSNRIHYTDPIPVLLNEYYSNSSESSNEDSDEESQISD